MSEFWLGVAVVLGWQAAGLVVASLLDRDLTRQQIGLALPVFLWPVVPLLRLGYRLTERR